jgi:hypothetical protein
MKIPPTVAHNVEEGLILDREAGWIPLADALRRQREFLSHLERGDIPVKGRWQRLGSAETSCASPSRGAGDDDMVIAGEHTAVSDVDDDTPVPSDTVLVEIEEGEDPEKDDGDPLVDKEDTQPMPKVTHQPPPPPHQTRSSHHTTTPPRTRRRPADTKSPVSPPASKPPVDERSRTSPPGRSHQALIDSLDDWDNARRKGRTVAVAVSAAAGGVAIAVFVVIKLFLA